MGEAKRRREAAKTATTATTATTTDALLGVQTRGATSLRVALIYAGMGCRVIPLDRRERPRLADWRGEATADEETIRGWWSLWPDSAVGVSLIGTGVGVIEGPEKMTLRALRRFGIEPQAWLVSDDGIVRVPVRTEGDWSGAPAGIGGMRIIRDFLPVYGGAIDYGLADMITVGSA